MEDERGGLVPDGATFARALDALKRDGSNILLVGEETEAAHETVCQRLFGPPERESVYRLQVSGEGTRVACESACHAPEANWFRTIEYSGLATEPGTNPTVRGGPESPRELGIELVEAVDEFADAADGFEPAELRVCVDSLVPLCREYEIETVFRLLHLATSRVDRARGIGHFHLPLARDRDVVSLVEPLFDAVVTVRSRDGIAEQRWSLRDPELSTDWLELSRPN
ncbi:hypothetical protein [Natrinema sp. DC36]|uniref:DUF7504 family protein n=1 Tax=Natrinema sp. DC36 TaxID=2878680 RepID=UPI001CF0AC60|nr:hypothetical protein [Natrinema sp. DC36]